MRAEEDVRGMDLQAVAAGWVWGLAVLLVGGTILAVVAWQGVGGPEAMGWGATGLRALAGLLGGFRAGGRAVGHGWLHGLLTGLALMVLLGVVDSVRAAVPGTAALLRSGGVLAVTGALGGIVGANLRR